MRIILICMLFNLIEITADARHSRTYRRAITDLIRLKLDF
mgnify:FL=1|jgi:hypothetical protein